MSLTDNDRLDALRACGVADPAAVLAALKAQGVALYRRKLMLNPRRRTVSAPVTDELRAAVEADFLTTGLTQHEIAERHGVNVGRVNEIVHGLRRAA